MSSEVTPSGEQAKKPETTEQKTNSPDFFALLTPLLKSLGETAKANEERELKRGRAVGTISFVLAFIFALFAASVYSSFERYYQSREELITDNGSARLAAEKAETALQKMTQILEFAKATPNDPLQGPPDIITEPVGSTRIDQLQILSQSASEALKQITKSEPPRRRFGFSLISSAYAETSSAPETVGGKFAFLRPLLLFLMFAPAAACVAGFFCVFNKSKEVVSFGTNLITSVMGYYFGAGVSLMTAMLS